MRSDCMIRGVQVLENRKNMAGMMYTFGCSYESPIQH
jgi:hypothetical protein